MEFSVSSFTHICRHLYTCSFSSVMHEIIQMLVKNLNVFTKKSKHKTSHVMMERGKNKEKRRRSEEEASCPFCMTQSRCRGRACGVQATDASPSCRKREAKRADSYSLPVQFKLGQEKERTPSLPPHYSIHPSI